MKYFFGIFLSLVAINCTYAKTVTVGEIVDGDTFLTEVSEGSIPVTVNILGVDAPEMNSKCESAAGIAIKAKERLEELLPAGSVVEVKDFQEVGNRHKKLKGHVVLSDGRDVGQILIKENLAHTFDGRHRRDWCK